MAKYTLHFWFEWLGPCLWGADEETKKKFGYAVDLSILPITEELRNHLIELRDEHDESLNWEYPPDPSPWTSQQKSHFLKRTEEAYKRLCSELGEEFQIIYSVDVPD